VRASFPWGHLWLSANAVFRQRSRRKGQGYPTGKPPFGPLRWVREPFAVLRVSLASPGRLYSEVQAQSLSHLGHCVSSTSVSPPIVSESAYGLAVRSILDLIRGFRHSFSLILLQSKAVRRYMAFYWLFSSSLRWSLVMVQLRWVFVERFCQSGRVDGDLLPTMSVTPLSIKSSEPSYFRESSICRDDVPIYLS
jgi:hypothetical protein